MRTLLLAALAFSLSACINVSWDGGERVDGSGVVAERTVEVSGVREVRLATPGTLVIERGAAPLRIEGDDNILPRIEAEVRGGTLVIEAEDGYSLRPEAPLRYRVGVDRLEGIAVAGSGDVEALAATGEDLSVDIAGSGSAIVRGVETGMVRVSIAGSGDVALAGRATGLEIEVAGSGDIAAADLAVDEATVEIAGSGDVELRAEKTLDVSVAGSGSIRYHGAPEISRSIVGSGEVVRADG